MRVEGTYLNILRSYDKPTANVILSGEKILCYVYIHTHICARKYIYTYTHTMEYCSAIRQDILPFGTPWMDIGSHNFQLFFVFYVFFLGSIFSYLILTLLMICILVSSFLKRPLPHSHI